MVRPVEGVAGLAVLEVEQAHLAAHPIPVVPAYQVIHQANLRGKVAHHELHELCVRQRFVVVLLLLRSAAEVAFSSFNIRRTL